MDAILAALEALQKQSQAAQAPTPPAPNPKPAASPPKRVPPAHAVAPSPPHPEPHHAPTGSFQGMFEDGNTLMRAIIASEVLGPPAALRENHFWNQQPNEPSI